MPQTMFDKIWDRHVVTQGPGGQTLLYVDRHLLHEGSTSALSRLEQSGRSVRRPDRCVATADHYLPTSPPATPIADPEVRAMIEALARHAGARGIPHFGVGDARRGIVHVIGPEQGLTQPGILLVCGDSHTATHGALGALAFGVGSSEVEHVLVTQCLGQRKPRVVAGLRGQLHASPGARITVDLETQTVTAPDGATHRFDVDPFRKQALRRGQDEIALTLSYETEIAAFETGHAQAMPWLGGG